jgi:hypothetical protein
LTEPQEQAALLIAQGRLSQAVIAKRAEISKRTPTYWQKEPEFRETVARHRDGFRKAAEQQREEISKHGLALKTERIFQKMRRHAQLRKVQGAIAKWFEEGAVKPLQNYLDGIGVAAGLVCIRYKGKDGDVPEFAINTALLQGYDEIERDIAVEVGDWKEKREIRCSRCRRMLPRRPRCCPPPRLLRRGVELALYAPGIPAASARARPTFRRFCEWRSGAADDERGAGTSRHRRWQHPIGAPRRRFPTPSRCGDKARPSPLTTA